MTPQDLSNARLPSAWEINPFDDLDGRVAERNFLGKTLAEAESLFRENSIYYQEDLLWMGPVAFRFYLKSAINYIRSDAAAGDSGMISFFAGTLEHRLEFERHELGSVAAPLEAICRYVLDHYDRFDIMSEVYGDLRPKYESLRQSFLQMTNS